MQNLEQAAAQWTAGALVFVEADGQDLPIVRPAAFVFATPTGLLWIEPAYASAAGAAGLALHERTGQPVPDGAGFVLVTPGERVTVMPYDPAAEDGDLVDGALEWFAGYLQGTGRTWAEERERVRGLVLGDQ